MPDVNESPNWSEGLVEFFQAVADALESSVGTYDVVPQTFTMASNANSNVDITPLSFPTANVQSVLIQYAIYRSTNTNSEAEAGQLELVYNAMGSTGFKWQMSRSYTGTSTVTFAVNDTGQISFSSTAIAGTGHAGKIIFAAKALQQSY